MNDNDKPDAKIIQFPINPSRVNNNVRIDNTGQEIRENMIFADNLTEGLIVNIVHNMQENGLETNDTEFVRDISFLIEFIKSTIYRDLGMEHSMQDLVDLVVTTTRGEDGHLKSSINLPELERIIEKHLND